MRLSYTCSIIIFFAVLALQVEVHADDFAMLLKKIQNYDEIYAASLTARGTVVNSPQLESPYLGEEHKTWVLTLQNERHALVETQIGRDLTYHPATEYLQYGDDLPGIAFDEYGNLIRGFPSFKAVSFEPDRSATVDVSSVVQISPEGKVLSEKDNRAVMRYGPGNYTLAYPINKIRWVLGRGFSSCLDRIIEVKDAGRGLLDLVAEGTGLAPGHFGKWKLTLDPESQYLVRSAVFSTRWNADKAYLTITNSEPTTVGSVVYPKTGKCILNSLNDATSEFTFDSVVFEAAPSVFDEARRHTDNQSSARTLTMDHTVVPAKTDYVSENHQSVASKSPMEEKSPDRTLILVNIILIVILVVFLTFRAARR